MKYYVLFVWGDVEPSLIGPFPSWQKRDTHAKALKEEHGDEHGIYALNVSTKGNPRVDAYSGGFFRDEDGPAPRYGMRQHAPAAIRP